MTGSAKQSSATLEELLFHPSTAFSEGERRNPPSWRFMTADHDPPYELRRQRALLAEGDSPKR
jgi:hypothetical protein